MDLTCYLNPGWKPLIRPAPSTRPWMEATDEKFASRCLPLNIANAHGWEILTPTAFVAMWTGGDSIDDVKILLPDGVPRDIGPLSIFGNGVLTFHVHGLFHTPPGWNLWVGGSPNRLRDAIQPLTGVIETDWAAPTFTMNWKFTRPDVWVHFLLHDPFCHFFPIPRGYLNDVEPSFRPMSDDPDLRDRHEAWNVSRRTFNEVLKSRKPGPREPKWQKHYFQGTDVDGAPGADDHQTKLKLKPFKPA